MTDLQTRYQQLRWLLEQELTPIELKLALFIFENSTEIGEKETPLYLRQHLANKLGCSISSVSNATTSLKRKGIIRPLGKNKNKNKKKYQLKGPRKRPSLRVRKVRVQEIKLVQIDSGKKAVL